MFARDYHVEDISLFDCKNMIGKVLLKSFSFNTLLLLGFFCFYYQIWKFSFQMTSDVTICNQVLKQFTQTVLF